MQTSGKRREREREREREGGKKEEKKRGRTVITFEDRLLERDI